jgi:ribosomal protein S18 acetylase RimI-like enzyme
MILDPTIIDWKESLRDVDWSELSALYKVAPLGDKSPDVLRTAFSNSMFRWFAYEEGRLIAAGRALADGVDCSYICDVAVLPSHQGKGVGREIITRLVRQSQHHRKIILYSVPGKESFYKKFGFKRMSTAMAIFRDQDRALAQGYLIEQ